MNCSSLVFIVVIASFAGTVVSMPQMVGLTYASIQDQNASQDKSSESSASTSNPNQQAINHISEAQSALQKGDTKGAHDHMTLAKQALGCKSSPWDPRPC